jgi:glycosyltransferase involved in cell wall biosynthesis
VKVAVLSASRIPSRTANSIQVMHTSQAAAELGHSVRLWVPRQAPPAAWPDLAGRYGLERPFDIRWTRSLPFLRRYDFCVAAVRAARAWGADLLYVLALPAAAMAARTGTPTVLELHEPPSGRLGPVWLHRFLRAPGARRVVVISHALSRTLAERYAPEAGQIDVRILPNGVDLRRYRDLPSPREARRRLGLEDRVTAMYTGHLYRGRGMEVILELARSYPELGFVCVGGEDAAVEGWRRLALQAGVRNLRLIGYVEHGRVPLYQAAGDVLLMPYATSIAGSSGGDSAAVASPMKMFEYLAAGRPILASDLPAIREILHEDTSILIRPGDADEWRLALRRVLADPSAMARMAAAGREAARNHTWQARMGACLQGLP